MNKTVSTLYRGDLSSTAKAENRTLELAKEFMAALTILAMITVVLVSAGCGGSGGAAATSSQLVTGTAAVGAPLSGQVSLKDSSTPPMVRSTTIGEDGSFALDVTGLKAPYVLQAVGTASGASFKLHSYAEGTGTANINPLADAIVASAAGVDDPSDVYEKADSDHNHRIGGNLQSAISTFLAKLQPLLKQYSAEHTNPITAHYIANHLGLDGMFDHVKLSVNNGILTITMGNGGAVVFSGKLSDIANGIFNNGALPPVASAPAAPASLSAAGGTNQVTLTWPGVSGATSYNVYYATTSGVTKTTGTKIASVASPYLQTGLAAATTYYYVVTAVNGAGESSASTQASATTAAAAPAPTPPAAPAGAKATGGTNQVTLSWNAVSGATSYNVYYATASGVTKATGTKIAGATSPAVLTGLSASTTYYLIVSAVNAAGEGAASAQVSATTLSAVPTPTIPSAPAGVSATGGTNQIAVSWSPVSGATSYNLYYSTTSGVTPATGTKVAGAGSGSTVTGLAAGTTYYAVVTAVNAAGESPASAQVSAATATAVPAFDALSYYDSVCLGCHGSLGPRTAAQITSAIANFGAMRSLSTLTAAQISAIAAVSH